MEAQKGGSISPALVDITRSLEQVQITTLKSLDSSKINKKKQAPEHSKDHFKHKPLDQFQQSIRLLQFSPRANGDLDFELQHFTFKEAPKYRALSYMWGDGRLRAVIINGRSFLVRDNLYMFLETTKASDTDGYLWIDQICIDQTNLSERNQQVSFMASIYGRAKEVVIWLGVCGQADEETAAFINHFTTHELGSTVCQYRSTQHLSRPLHSFLHNPYWSRLWVVQEILKARALTIKWGTFEVQWRALASMLLGYRHCDVLGEIPFQLRRMAECALNRIGVNRGVFKFTSAFCTSRCQDPRDKVYGLLAITHLNLQVVDYARSIEEVFLDAVYAMDQEVSPIGFVDFVQLVRTLAVAMLAESDSEDKDQSSAQNLSKNAFKTTQLPTTDNYLLRKDVRRMTLLQFVVAVTGYAALEVAANRPARKHPVRTTLVRKSFHELILLGPMVPVLKDKKMGRIPSTVLTQDVVGSEHFLDLQFIYSQESKYIRREGAKSLRILQNRADGKTPLTISEL